MHRTESGLRALTRIRVTVTLNFRALILPVSSVGWCFEFNLARTFFIGSYVLAFQLC
jgi:hypothetical protein